MTDVEETRAAMRPMGISAILAYETACMSKEGEVLVNARDPQKHGHLQRQLGTDYLKLGRKYEGVFRQLKSAIDQYEDGLRQATLSANVSRPF